MQSLDAQTLKGYVPDLFTGFEAPSTMSLRSGSDAKPIISSQNSAKPLEEVKSESAFKSISEAAEMLGLPQHVLRFWESKFPQIKPIKLKGGRRYYRPDDIESLFLIKHLLYKQGYTIKGARKAFSEARRNREHEEPMADASTTPRKAAKRKAAAGVESTPLFSAMAPAAPVEVAATLPQVEITLSPVSEQKKQQLSALRDELMDLKQMLASLPPLRT